MKKTVRDIISLSLMLLLLTAVSPACTSDVNNEVTRQGYIDLTVNVIPQFVTSAGQPQTIDKDLVPAADNLSLTLTDNLSGASHTWATVSDFVNAGQSYMAGEYTITASGCCKNGPMFQASTTVTIPPGQHVPVNIDVRPADAMIQAKRIRQSSDYSLAAMTIYAPEQGFVSISNPDSILYVSPGKLQAYALVDDGTRQVLMALPVDHTMTAGQITDLTIALDGDMLTASANGSHTSRSLANGIPDSAPAISPLGFSPGTTVEAMEGLTLPQPIKMAVSSDRPLRSLQLTMASELIRQASLPYNSMDLLNLTDEQKQLIGDAGLTYTIADDNRAAAIDFTHLIEELSSQTSTLSQFTLLAEDTDGACSQPLSLTVNTHTLTMSLQSTGAAVIGVDTATLTLITGSEFTEQADFTVLAADAAGTYSIPCPVTDMTRNGNNITLTIKVPTGTEPVKTAIFYLGQQRLTATVERVNPNIIIETDPYATSALLRIVPEQHNEYSAEQITAITRLASFTVNGAPASIWTRDNEHGAVVINGLTAERTYTFAITLAGTSPAASVRATTETARPIPGADFNDWHEVFKYNRLPQGGRFSATSVPVINRQNYVDIVYNWPKKYWASVNELTFDRRSTNHNTWYMQLSTVLEGINSNSPKAMRLTSVGYDHNGGTIADYVQQPGQQLPYSNAVPTVKSRAAGRLWLGEYNAATGRIVQGVPFTSRPSALNGFFKFLPDITDSDDRGTVDIALVHRNADGNETVVASGHREFRTASDFTAFNLQLTYILFDIKPTHLRLMFCSSVHADFDNGDADVPLTAIPRDGAMTGSTLWISQLSFAY